MSGCSQFEQAGTQQHLLKIIQQKDLIQVAIEVTVSLSVILNGLCFCTVVFFFVFFFFAAIPQVTVGHEYWNIVVNTVNDKIIKTGERHN